MYVIFSQIFFESGQRRTYFSELDFPRPIITNLWVSPERLSYLDYVSPSSSDDRVSSSKFDGSIEFIIKMNRFLENKISFIRFVPGRKASAHDSFWSEYVYWLLHFITFFIVIKSLMDLYVFLAEIL